MKIKLVIGRLLTMASLSVGLANAAVITTFTDFLLSTDPTQTGRLSRNNAAQDWADDEAFPGVINTTSVYHYQTYSVNVGNTPFIEIDVDSLAATTFVSVYDTSYAPNSVGTGNLGFDTNWLGDAGTSSDFFGVDPIFFQIVAPVGDNIIIVVNQTSVGTTAAAGIGSTDPYTIEVEGFIDSEFTDPPSTPEPSTIFMSVGGLIALAGFVKRRRSANAR